MAIIPRRMISCLTGKAEAIAPTVRDALPFEALHPIDGMTRALEMRRYGLAEHRLVLDQQDAHGTFDTAAIEHCAPILTET